MLKKANEPESKDKKTNKVTGQNVNFGKVKSNKSKAVEFEDSKIAYTFTCRRCKKKIEMSQKDVDRYASDGLELPKTCSDCKKALDEEIDVGKCKFCGTVIRMKRSKYEHLQKEGKFFVRSSRVIDGIVFGDDIFDPHHIMIPSLTLSPYKARILLMLGLAYTKNLNTLKEIFIQY